MPGFVFDRYYTKRPIEAVIILLSENKGKYLEIKKEQINFILPNIDSEIRTYFQEINIDYICVDFPDEGLMYSLQRIVLGNKQISQVKRIL